MGSLPALYVNPPQDPTQGLQRAVQLRSLLQNAPLELQQRQQAVQSGQLQLQQQQQAIKDQQAITAAWKSWDGKSPDSLIQGVLNAGGSGQAANQLDMQMLSRQQQHLALDESQFKMQQQKTDRMLGRFTAAEAVSDDQLPAHVQGAILESVNAGDLSPREAQIGYQLLQQTAGNSKALRDGLDAFQKSHMLDSQIAARAKEQAETAKNVADAALKQQQTTEVQTRTSQMGQVTPEVRFVQAQENNRAALGRQAANQNNIGRAGLASLEKSGDDYTKFAGQMMNLKTNLAAAKTGDEVASAFAPIATVLGLNAFNGTHRISPAEAQAAGPELGSVYRQMDTWFSKNTTGTLNSDSVKEFQGMVDRLLDAKYQGYRQQTDYTVRLHGLSNDTPVLGRDGSITTTGARATAAANGPVPQPAEATMKVPGSDGHMHWSDGKKDLGRAD
jgi:hypothetical protein